MTASDERALRNYVGLSCSGHDNALAIVDSSGEVVFAEASERYHQNKRALNVPPDDMFYIASLIEAHCEANAEIVVCKTWSEAADAHIEETTKRVASSVAALESVRNASGTERTRKVVDFIVQREKAYLHLASMYKTTSNAAGRNLSYHFYERVAEQRRYEHHLTHAALACYTSPFDEATCIVVDGMGEGAPVSCFGYRNGSILPFENTRSSLPESIASLGLFYADLCSLCGFDYWKGEEWKVMGLAAYGSHDPQLHKLLSQCLELNGFSFQRSASETGALARLLQDCSPGGDWQRVADLACAGQRVFEDLLFALCKNVQMLTRSENLVLTGGCALNSSANGKLLAATQFKQLYVPCAPADDGNAAGAAMLAYFEDHPNTKLRRSFQTPYLGSEMSKDTLERALHSGFRSVERLDEGALCAFVSQRLCAGDLVGWVQGRAEFGPRALGNRSILADPRRPEMKDKINQAVKLREPFRPFAPAVLAEHGAHYFEDYQDSPYMERTLRFRSNARQSVPAAVHIDGTGRLQSVKAAWNPRFHRLLSDFYRVSGVPMLINTSFNIMGKPIVHSIEDAIAVFATTGLDVLVIEDCVFRKA